MAYGQVKDLVKDLGGTMEWVRGGSGGGGRWELTLGRHSKSVDIRQGDDLHNALDRLYVPKIPNPQRTSDYPVDREAELKADAPERLVRFLVDRE